MIDYSSLIHRLRGLARMEHDDFSVGDEAADALIGLSMEPPDDSKCEKDSDVGRCCCNCAHHVEDYHHPCTSGARASERRGWVCSPDAMHAYSGWANHGLCEMHMFDISQ